MPRRPVEKLSQALRRQAQVRAWQQSEKRTDLSAQSSPQPPLTSTTTEAGTVMPHAGSWPYKKEGEGSYSINKVKSKDTLIHANQSLREALARGSPETQITRQVQRAIQRSTKKSEAMKAFQVLLHADGEVPTITTFRTLAVTLLQHHVEERIGYDTFQKSLTDAIGTENERWKTLTEEERSAFVNYTCRMTERWAERGSSFNKLLGFSQEGADNEIVSQIEYQMRKSGAIISAGTISDLMHLDISWSTALHLYNYAGSLYRNISPPIEMTDRLMGLMTGYKTGLGGSRPWKHALKLYEEALASGYDITLTTHTHALDALWRSADTFHRVRSTISSSQENFIWQKAIEISQHVQDTKLLIAGEEGCAYAEGVVKAFAASGRWSMAVSFLGNLDISSADTTHRSLVPTAETYVFAIAACLSAGHASHGEALWTLFRESYSLRSLHSEVLLILLQSFRHVVRTLPMIGSIVEDLVNNGKGLERPIIVACLQLLSTRYVTTVTKRHVLARKLFDMYDASPWPQQPTARAVELQTVFRCGRLIAAVSGETDGAALVAYVRGRVSAVFGPAAVECRWFDAAVVHHPPTGDNSAALRALLRRPPPVPPRQTRAALLAALRAATDGPAADAASGLTDEDTQEDARGEAARAVRGALAITNALHTTDDTFPHRYCAKMLLIQANTAAKVSERKKLALRAMHHFSQDSGEGISQEDISNLAESLSLTEVHVEHALLQTHATLRFTTLSQKRRHQGKKTDVYTAFDGITW
ncbi:uncharacterized protein TM35_000021160 [Trypanosoma theileri]|uniref:Uncharacterized protein n=1 Tax=Trypanosoma theileri TaxID=67003 RepID=A0A1X0P8M4_9TRYP|nr:uncharacterized protein TM35_000021160 [Trypanosoma theileri]ORC92790.1 hypothetical protein TM35_000021160 [Trypanosoma theileri]